MVFSIFRLSLVAAAFLSVVLPNSLQVETAAALVICALTSIMVMKKARKLLTIFFLYGLSVLITVIYVLVGVIKGAPPVAVLQIITVYVLSPLLWILVAAAIHSRISSEAVVKWIVILTVAASISVAIFFYLFLNYGAGSVAFFIETANINLTDGYVGATMSVYGSFIFLAGALFSAPTIIGNKLVRIFCLVSVLAVIFTSGRSALILSFFIGITIFFVFGKVGEVGRPFKGGAITISLVFLLSISVYFYFSSFDLGLILQLFYEELTSGGGQERVEQSLFLLKGVADTWALGAGHGIGVDYIRSDDYPWRYELVWVATLYRVGLIGFLVYLLPILFYFSAFFRFYRARLLSKLDIFMFGGFICALIASNTNPYAEAFTFQWMYVIPIVFMLLKSKNSSDVVF